MFRALFPSAPLRQALAAAILISAQAHAASGLDGSEVLYDQSTQGNGGASPTQHMSAAADEIADDFEVTGASGWTVTDLKFSVSFVDPDSTPPGQPPYDIAIYPDDNGKPAAAARCSAPSAAGTTNASAPGGELNVTVHLPAACVLAPGRYWVAMSVVLQPPPYSMWAYVDDTPPAFSEPVYRNPDNVWGTGCVTWTPAYSQRCLVSFSEGMPNMVFQVLGSTVQADAVFADGFDS
jgi:hypothetical protein